MAFEGQKLLLKVFSLTIMMSSSSYKYEILILIELRYFDEKNRIIVSLEFDVLLMYIIFFFFYNVAYLGSYFGKPLRHKVYGFLKAFCKKLGN